jgi:LAS superfamily LD-carboxypeptidase LdcB
MIVEYSFLVPNGTSVSGDLTKQPPQPTQDQVTCYSEDWQKQNLTTVDTEKISKKLAPYINKLLADSKSTGYTFTTTSGFRTCAYQEELRSFACSGTDEFSLRQKDPETCSPPTEPAGRSLHNEGLAIDFGCQGYNIFAFSPCYNWLVKEAYKYQLKNRPGEPWHWSTTGR